MKVVSVVLIKRGDWITIGSGANKQIIGQQVKFKIHKSKVSVPLKTGMWNFYFDEGGVVPPGHIDNFKEIVLEAVAYGVVERAGAWLSYKDLKVQGAENLVETLRENPDLFEDIKEELMKVALEQFEEEYAEYKENEKITDEDIQDTIDNIDETIEAVKQSAVKSKKKTKKGDK